MVRLTRDLAIDKGSNPALDDTWEEEDGNLGEDEGDNIIDRSESPWPGEYIDLTRQKGHRANTNWPRPA